VGESDAAPQLQPAALTGCNMVCVAASCWLNIAAAWWLACGASHKVTHESIAMVAGKCNEAPKQLQSQNGQGLLY
jgi:hypothetical protein